MPNRTHATKPVQHTQNHHKNTVTTLGLVSLLFSALFTLAGCQSISHTQAASQTKAASHASPQQICKQYSQYSKPVVSGQIIETTNYILVTMINQPQAKKSEGELCIINKTTQLAEITAIDALRFLAQ